MHLACYKYKGDWFPTTTHTKSPTPRFVPTFKAIDPIASKAASFVRVSVGNKINIPANPTKMDQNEDLKLQTAEKFSKCQFLKRTLQFVFTVSIFSSFVWYSSGHSILPQSFNAYFSTFLFSMFTHTLERKYMFLVFNGILAFLIKSSVFSSPSISAFNIETPLSIPPETKISAYDQEVVPLKSTIGSSESASFMPTEEEELEQDAHKEQVSEAEGQEGGILSKESKEKENEGSIAEEEGYEGETGSEASVVEEEDYEGETGNEVLVRQDDEADIPMVANEELDNTDELNRKFEEFIRKMKEEIRIEAQRQLIAVQL